ncbi:YtxH domain-containing protein [Candidatus Avelusimicrobium luingense]|uniref:YtxH domain-containing protein n=1 Tax=Candidatus Avelusimicrobium luingense TaxID=3416211 RepID=UPI003D15147B
MCNRNAETGLAAFLLGAVTGIALGLLFAPAKGETTRRKLKRWADDTYEEQKEYVLEHAGHAREKIAEHVENAREKIAEGKEKVMKEWNKRKDEISAKFHKEEEK